MKETVIGNLTQIYFVFPRRNTVYIMHPTFGNQVAVEVISPLRMGEYVGRVGDIYTGIRHICEDLGFSERTYTWLVQAVEEQSVDPDSGSECVITFECNAVEVVNSKTVRSPSDWTGIIAMTVVQAVTNVTARRSRMKFLTNDGIKTKFGDKD